MTTRRSRTGMLIAAILTAATAAAQPSAPARTYGEGVSARPAVAVQALLEHPERYVGQTVRVDGTVSAVCQHMGCWLEIADPVAGRGVRFKVRDGVIVFPKAAVGRRASAEGVFEEIATSPVREHHGGDPRAADASGVPAAGAPADKLYWVRASGAVLHD